MRGSNLNPIDLDEPEETVDIEAIKEEKRNRQIIEEAKLSKTPLYLCLAAIKTTIKGDIRHKNMALNRAIIKYFEGKVGINISNQHFHPRPDPDYFDENCINPKQFLIYGVDFLTTSQIKDRFNIFQPQIHELMWINSSTCKIKYKTESQARTILRSVVADPKVLSTKINQIQDQYPQGWFTMNNYQIYYFQRQLLIRYSTEKENDLEKQTLEKFDNFERAQEELLRHLLDHFDAQQAFQDVIRQVERERNDATNRHRYYSTQRLNHHRQRSRTRERLNSKEPNNRPYQRRDNRFRKSYEPEQVRLREVREIHYEHQPTSMRRRNQDEYPRRLKAPARGNVYYDCNDIDYDPSNLSFDFHEQEHNSDRDDLDDIDLSIAFHDNPHRSRKDPDLSLMSGQRQKVEKSSSNPDLSFVFNNSKMENKQDLSILFNNSKAENNPAQNNDLSILLNNSRVENNHLQNNDLSIILNNSIAQNNPPQNNDLSILLNNSTIQKTDNNNHDLSIIFNSSKAQNKDNNRNADISLLMQEAPDRNNVLDTSIKIERNKQASSVENNALDTSLKFEPKNEPTPIENQEVDYEAFLGFNVDQISPIHQNIFDSSFQFEHKGNEKVQSMSSKEKEVDYLDFKRPEKKKKRETRIILDSDDSGY